MKKCKRMLRALFATAFLATSIMLSPVAISTTEAANTEEQVNPYVVADDLSIEIQISQNSKMNFYNFFPYRSIYISKEFHNLRKQKLASNSLIGTNTVIEYKKGGVPKIQHKIVAAKVGNTDFRPIDRLEIRTTSMQFAEECVANYEGNGFKLKTEKEQGGMHVIVFQK